MPELSPLLAADYVCDRCGETMSKTVIKNAQGRPLKMEYTCHNQNTGCGYKFESDARASAMQTPTKDAD